MCQARQPGETITLKLRFQALFQPMLLLSARPAPPKAKMGVYKSLRGRSLLVFGLIVTLFSSLGTCDGLVNIAAAFNSRVYSDTAAHVFYQSPDGDLHQRSYIEGRWSSPQNVPTTIPPKLNTPLAMWFNDVSPVLHRVC
jgi:hypothetical protein